MKGKISRALISIFKYTHASENGQQGSVCITQFSTPCCARHLSNDVNTLFCEAFDGGGRHLAV